MISRYRILFFVLVLAMAGSVGAQTSSGTITSDGTPIFGAAVYWASQPTGGTFSGGGGVFTLKLPEGDFPDTLKVEYLGFAPSKTVFTEAPTEDIAVSLETSAIAIAEIAVTANRTAGQVFAPEQLQQLDIYLSPNSSADPLKAVQNVAGATITDETANPVLRGSGAGRNRVLFNGVPIRNPVRNSTINGLGYFSIFSPEFVDRLDVYPSTPPLSRAATAGGLIDIHSVNKLEAEQNQVSLSLASVGGYFSRAIKGDDEHFVQVYLNHQLSGPFKAANGNRFDFLEDFHNTNVGVNYHRPLGKHAQVNVFSSAMKEGSEVFAPFLNYEGTAVNSTRRWFNVVNFRYFKGRTAISFNSGTNFNSPYYKFGNIEADYSETNLHHALYVDHYATDRLTLRAGVSAEYHDYSFTNTYPQRYYAFRPEHPTANNDTSINLWHPELILYADWEVADNLQFGAGIRKNIAIGPDARSYLARQISLRYEPHPSHMFSLGGGRYNDFFTPNVNVQSFELLTSTQYALEYTWTAASNFSLSAAVYHKQEEGLVDLNQPEIGEIQIWGAELGLKGKAGKRFSYFLNVTHLDKKIDLGEQPVPARDDLDYLATGGMQYLHEKLGAFSITVNARPGLRYTSITGGVFEEDFGVYRPVYSPQSNGERLDDYRRISFGYSRSFKLGRDLNFLGFLNLSNLEGRQNEQTLYYDESYQTETLNYFPGLSLYFGGIISW
ncbi:TonB-dependent receptor [Neolewinella aurantiaca]|uniref:TonB-dependent receptor n=1 Tax=Neolewinella aurantiaca TaxID=2602767 RepID=A0A5C7FCC2_9BACT|nr:TonB-dependent receptor plug domain-containing protein [Neolewinella aurantiaca]TXF87120.1 TonB-dependent receptor [Neolewinella aurantiaca]